MNLSVLDIRNHGAHFCLLKRHRARCRRSRHGVGGSVALQFVVGRKSSVWNHGRSGKPWWAGSLLAKATVEDVVGSDRSRSADESVGGRSRSDMEPSEPSVGC